MADSHSGEPPTDSCSTANAAATASLYLKHASGGANGREESALLPHFDDDADGRTGGDGGAQQVGELETQPAGEHTWVAAKSMSDDALHSFAFCHGECHIQRRLKHSLEEARARGCYLPPHATHGQPVRLYAAVAWTMKRARSSRA